MSRARHGVQLSLLILLCATGCARVGRADPPASLSASVTPADLAVGQVTGRAVPDSAVRPVDIGFSMGYLARVPRYDTALSRLHADGFRIVRVYEPFTRHLTPGFSDIVDNLRTLTRLGLTPYLSMSNFPYSLEPADPSAVHHRSDELPPARMKGVLAYSNRWPPDSYARYGDIVRSLADTLVSEFGRKELRSWYIEIGNEPDAPLYFWGDASAFAQVYRTAVDAFMAADSSLRVGGAAFTSGLLANPARRPDFEDLARQIASVPATRFFSFHIYDNSFSGSAPSPDVVLRFTPARMPLVVSEWNVSTRPSGQTASILDSEAFGPYLIRIVQLCHETRVDVLLVHKLIDNPPPAKEQLGLIRSDGTPKMSYRLLKFMQGLSREGFTVSHASGLVILRGGGRMAVLAHEAAPVDWHGWKVTYGSPGVHDGMTRLSKGSWAFLKRPS